MLTTSRHYLWILLTVIPGLAALPSLADESIARIEQVNRGFESPGGDFRLTVHSRAWISNITVGNFKIAELSGLAWDSDEKRLYALSDNGYVLILEPEIRNRQLFSIALSGAFALLDARGNTLKYKPSDSEGLALVNNRNKTGGDTELLVSFERLPRIMRYSTDGKLLEELQLPPVLSNISNYQSENKSLESIAVHDKFGVITGSELPLQQAESGQMSVYDLSGKRWEFQPYNSHYGALVSLDSMPDGNLIAMERSYGGLFPVMEITLHRLLLEDNGIQHQVIHTFDSRDGLVDENFEGITRYEGEDYFIISDDNNNPFNRTVLVYFSITRTTE